MSKAFDPIYEWALAMGRCGADYAYRELLGELQRHRERSLSRQGVDKMIANIIGFASR